MRSMVQNITRGVKGRRGLQINTLNGRMREYHRCAACGIEYRGKAGIRKAKYCAEKDAAERRAQNRG